MTIALLQWLRDANIDLGDPVNAGLRELRALLASDDGDAADCESLLRLTGTDESHLRPPSFARQDRWRGARAQWQSAASRAALGRRRSALALWRLEHKAVPEATQPAGAARHLALAMAIRRVLLQDHLSRVLSMQARLARTRDGKCAVLTFAQAPPPPCSIFRPVLLHHLGP